MFRKGAARQPISDQVVPDLAGLALLQTFLENPRRVLERSWLLNEVWGFDFPTTANSLEVYIGYLRRKTEGEGESRLIHTVRGIGYVLRETPP